MLSIKPMRKLNKVNYYGGRKASLTEILAIENKQYYSPVKDVSKYRDHTLIIIVTYTCLPAIKLCLECVIRVLEQRSDVYALVLDNDSGSDISKYLQTIQHQQMDVIYIGQNLGKAIAVSAPVKSPILGSP